MPKTWRCRLQRTFFGLDDTYIQQVYEQIFVLKYHGGWSFTEAYSLPTMIRNWYVQRLQQQFEMEKEAMEQAQSNSKKY
jgi:hypothetical protein